MLSAVCQVETFLVGSGGLMIHWMHGRKKKTPSKSHADSLVLPWQFIIVLTIVRGKLAIDQVYSIYHPPLV